VTVIHDSDDNEAGKGKELRKRNKLTFEDQESTVDEVYDSEDSVAATVVDSDDDDDDEDDNDDNDEDYEDDDDDDGGDDDDDDEDFVQDTQEMLTEEELNDLRMAEKREKERVKYEKAQAKQALAHRKTGDKKDKVRNDSKKKNEKSRKSNKTVNDFSTKKGTWTDLGIERTSDRNFLGYGYFAYMGKKKRQMGKLVKYYENAVVEVNYEKGGENVDYKFSMPPAVFAALLRAGPNVLEDSEYSQQQESLNSGEEEQK